MRILSRLILSLTLLLSITALTLNFLYPIIDSIYVNPKVTVKVLGTGSMFPTFPKGSSKDLDLNAKEVTATPLMLEYPNGLVYKDTRYFSYSIQHGDIVSFKDPNDSVGYIKRVVGLPGDTVELRSGLVYLNGDPLKEPYTALPHSTFGGTFLSECKKVTIPDSKMFVLGDNRKESDDSRFDLGLVDMSRVDGVMPESMQKGIWDTHYRNTDKDLDESSKIKLDTQKFVELLNGVRQANHVGVLKSSTLLEKSAVLRADSIFKFNDFSFEGKISHYSMETALAEAGYSNTTWGEVPIQGYYTAEEVINFLTEFSKSREFILNKEFGDVGVSTVEGSLDGCPTQLIIIHFGGYVPPNYDKKLVDSWSELLNSLKDVQGGWKKLKTYADFYSKNKKDVDRINEILSTRISNVSQVVSFMTANKWLTKELQDYVNNVDPELSKEQKALADKLNSK